MPIRVARFAYLENNTVFEFLAFPSIASSRDAANLKSFSLLNTVRFAKREARDQGCQSIHLFPSPEREIQKPETVSKPLIGIEFGG